MEQNYERLEDEENKIDEPTAADWALLDSLDEAADAVERGEGIPFYEFIKMMRSRGYV